MLLSCLLIDANFSDASHLLKPRNLNVKQQGALSKIKQFVMGIEHIRCKFFLLTYSETINTESSFARYAHLNGCT